MAAAASRLLGPPEIHRRQSVSTAGKPAPSTGTPFLDLMDAGFNASPMASPPMGLTENLSATYLSSGDPCLDFFFQVVPDTPASTIASLLTSAWSQDPLASLKLVCHLRGVRGTGKSDRKGFYTAALWLHDHHPKTLALNAAPIADFGYMKDLPELLHLIVAGSNTRKRTPPASRRKSRVVPCGLRGRYAFSTRLSVFPTGNRKQQKQRKEGSASKEEKLADELAKVKIRADAAASFRREKKVDMAVRAVERYVRDPDYRFLHDATSSFFADHLLHDIDRLQSGELKGLSLAAKWCPSLDSSYDRSTLLCESIARLVFPRDSDPAYASLEEEHYAYRVRDRLRKEMLVPLRRALELPEVYMSAGQWGLLPYSRVPSVAMKNYKALFQKHDKERFSEYLSRVQTGKAKIAAGALLPHEILKAVMGEDDDKVAELQWKRMVKDLTEKGKLRNCIAVCDVSGSMCGTPMDVCVALGLLISELSEEPWKGRVITFSENPEMHRIEGESLKEKAEFVRRMDWEMNTNFQRVFDRILEVAKEGKMEAERMIKRVIVFSDMEFDQASANSWETDYQAICRKFREGGYGSVVPEIVFWNLRDSTSTPVPATEKGVAMVSGFSKNLVKLFLDGDGILSPRDVMEAAIAGEEYQKLMIFD